MPDVQLYSTLNYLNFFREGLTALETRDNERM
jgi:hypothetical protein